MSQMIDRGTLDRLIALGRARGELTAADLRAALPVDRMEVDALVLVMLELEAAGVSVEPDAYGPPTDRPAPGPARLPEGNPGMPQPVRPAAAGAATVEAAEPGPLRPAGPAERDPDEGRAVNRAVALAGLATLLLLGAALLIL